MLLIAVNSALGLTPVKAKSVCGARNELKNHLKFDLGIGLHHPLLAGAT